MSLRRVAALCVLLIVGILVAIAATGNMHRGRHHPAWVNAVSWLFWVAVIALIATGLAARKRRNVR